VILGEIADTLARGVESTVGAVSGRFFEPVVRLGVTGLSRSGKTVFISALVANLLNRGRMPGLSAEAEGRIGTAWLMPQPDDTVPRFDYEAHLAEMTGPEPRWPESTRGVSELRVTFRVQASGLLGGITGPRTVHLDIVDYPGEWLLDLGLLDLSFAQWSAQVLGRAAGRASAAGFLAALEGAEPGSALEEVRAQALAGAFAEYLQTARAAGFSDCTPGRFLLPGDLAGSPVLTFAPLPPGDYGRSSLGREFARRFEAYKTQVVKPFFRDHFARIDRQVVLVDALGAIAAGPAAVEDMRLALAEILGAFRPGRNAFLTRLLMGRRVEKILFAATKADHLHHVQHGSLAAISSALLADARARAEFAGAETAAMAIAALRATTEDRIERDGRVLNVVRGRLVETGRQVALYPGRLPEDPARILAPARDGAEAWLGAEYKAMDFAPQALEPRPGEGLPHIRLDRAAEFLIGDRL